MQQRSVDVVVIGGGIAGLAAAWTAQRAGLSVQLLEAAPMVGGKMRSERCDGYLIEHGPHSFLGSATTIWRLLDELHMTAEAVAAQPPSWRYVYRGGKARKLPTGLLSAITGDWLSLRGKLRALAEPWIAPDASETDSLAGFMTRRFGAEVADGLVAPFVTGIYAGDAGALGARDAFPTLWQFERDHGSVIRGAWARRRAARAVVGEQETIPRKRGLFSLKDGMAALPRALAERLGAAVTVGAQVTAIERIEQAEHSSESESNDTSNHRATSPRRRWQVRYTHSDVPHSDALCSLAATDVIVATPPKATHTLVASLSAAAAAPLAQAGTCPMVMVHLGGPTSDDAPRGFGALINRGENVRALGMLLPTRLFSGRAPPGHGCTAVFLGGAQDPEVIELSDDRLVELAMEARQQVFGRLADVDGAITFRRVVRWPQAIVQYDVGHRARMAQVTASLAVDAPGLWLAGAHLDGVSMSDAAASGIAAVTAITAGTAARTVAGTAAAPATP